MKRVLLFLLLCASASATNFYYPVTAPIKQWYDTHGLPLNNGYIYFGTANQNPQVAPITMYWDAGGTIPAAQPFRTSGGYITRQGTPANVYAAGDFSCSVYTSSGTLVFTQPTSVDLQLALSIAGASSAAAIPLADAGGYYTTDNVEAAFQQLGPLLAQMVTALAGTVPTGATFNYPASTGTLPPTGYVYGSGKSIGDATSGSTERANADTQALFVLLWNNSTNTQLQLQNQSGSNIGRSGVGALTDYNNHCRLATPDCRGRVIAGLGTMSSTSDAARLTTAGSGVDGATPMASGATQTHTMTTGELVSHTHTFTGTAHNHTATDAGHTHTVAISSGSVQSGVGIQAMLPASSINTGSGTASITVANTTATGTNSSTGSSTAFSVVQPTIVFTVIIKL